MAAFMRAGMADVEWLAAAMREFYAGERLAFSDVQVDALRALLADDSAGGVFILEEESVGPAGYFVLTYGYSLERGGKIALLDELFILPEARGRGLGAAAVEAAVQAARDAECLAVCLEVDRSNAAARRLYQRSGFADLGREVWSRLI